VLSDEFRKLNCWLAVIVGCSTWTDNPGKGFMIAVYHSCLAYHSLVTIVGCGWQLTHEYLKIGIPISQPVFRGMFFLTIVEFIIQSCLRGCF